MESSSVDPLTGYPLFPLPPPLPIKYIFKTKTKRTKKKKKIHVYKKPRNNKVITPQDRIIYDRA